MKVNVSQFYKYLTKIWFGTVHFLKEFLAFIANLCSYLLNISEAKYPNKDLKLVLK